MGIVSEIDPQTVVQCFATFFCVAKSNGLLRIIFDCRPLNRCCATPIPVGLATMSEILEKASALGINGIISGDFRAYFFEFKLPGSVGLLFGFLYKGRKFLSHLFAMGFSWSPAVSMGVSWIICLHGTEKNKSLGVNMKEVRSWENFQPFLNLYDKKGKQVGFITIVYDNIGVFTNDPGYVVNVQMSQGNVNVQNLNNRCDPATGNVNGATCHVKGGQALVGGSGL